MKEQIPDIEGKDESPYHQALRRQAQINTVANHLMQQIIGETPYKPDMEWEMWHRVRSLEDENGLPYGVSADDVYQHYLRFHEGE